MGPSLTCDSVEVVVIRLKLMVVTVVADPDRINNSCPVEKLHEACHPSDGIFGVAVAITFSVLDHIFTIDTNND